jgi:protein ImuB
MAEFGRAKPAFVPNAGAARLSLRYFRPPKPARVETVSGQPSQIAAIGVRGRVLNLAGPWRSSGDWWTVSPWYRDEWDIALSDGALYRLYCALQSSAWFLEGTYD